MNEQEKIIEELRRENAELKAKIEFATTDAWIPADETETMFADREEMEADRDLFVRNLGWLLSQTRDGVDFCERKKDKDGERVIVHYKYGGGEREIDITADSYAAIIRDVARRFQ